LKRLWQYRHILGSRKFIASLWHSRKNVLAANRGRYPVIGPYMVELDVTYRCNCRCFMCQRWQDPRRDELSLAEYRALAREFHGLGVCQVSIAGGEPLLRNDLPSIVAAFAGFGMSVNVCTNGILLQERAEALRRAGVSCVTVSLDGAGAETHEKARGAAGSYGRIEQGIRHLKARASHSRPLVRVRMTVSNTNVEELCAYYLKWTPIVDHVLVQAVHYSPDAFYTGPDSEAFQLDRTRLARQLDGLPLEKEHYVKTLMTSLRESGSFPRHRCYAGILMVRIDPWGNAYPCLEQHICVGSVRERGFRAVWESDAFNLARKKIAADDRCRCWYNNTALISRYGQWLYRTTAAGLEKDLTHFFHRFSSRYGLTEKRPEQAWQGRRGAGESVPPITGI